MSRKNHDMTGVDPVTGRQPRQWTLWGMTVGLLLIVAATLMPLLGYTAIFRWIYLSGAVLLLIARIFAPYTGSVLRIKRLYRMESWSALFFCVATFFMFYQPGIMRDWLAFTMAGGAVQVYTSLMIPRAVAKENKKRRSADSE